MLPVLSKLFPRVFHKNEKTKSHDREATFRDETGKLYNCRILLLDDSELTLSMKPKSSAKGQVLLEKVFAHLNLAEKDYFGLRYLDSTNQTQWLDPSRNFNSQLRTAAPHTFYFGVKFYAADPCKLHEEITRYQFFLQLKRDMLQGRLPVSFSTAADLAALSVQSELGDYDPKRHQYGYVSQFRFIPHQTEDLESRIMDIHKTLIGQVPAMAEYKYLNKAKWLDMYGVDLHPVQGQGNMEYFLGLTPTGIVVLRNKSKVGNYFWPRITKITFKQKVFVLRVRDKNHEENTYTFDCASKQACKHLWKCCVEHHAFFRLTSANQSYSAASKLFSLGSKYRYSGRTERQVLADMANRPQPRVIRMPSKRHRRRTSVENKPLGFIELKPSKSETVISTVAAPEPVHATSSRRQDDYMPAPDSPRSTRSAPWETGHHRKGGMFTSGRDSPLSVKSEKMMFPRRIPSESESDTGYRRRYRGRMESDTESEADRHYRRKSRIPADESGTESEASYRHRQRRSRKSAENLNHTEAQWLDIQRRVRDGTYAGPHELRPNGSLTSMASEASQHSRRRRKRSRSPGNKKPPEELAQHFKYIDPEAEGMTAEDMRDIPYTKVETDMQPIKVKHSPRMKHKQRNGKRRSCGDLSEKHAPNGIPEGEAPPPYAAPPSGQAQIRSSCPTLHPAEPNNNEPPVEELEMMKSPMVIQRNEAMTAPIVKTKPVAMFTATPLHQPLVSHSQSRVVSSANRMKANTPQPLAMFTSAQPLHPHNSTGRVQLSTQRTLPSTEQIGNKSLKHMREDSGLGTEQDSCGARYFYSGPHLPDPAQTPVAAAPPNGWPGNQYNNTYSHGHPHSPTPQPGSNQRGVHTLPSHHPMLYKPSNDTTYLEQVSFNAGQHSYSQHSGPSSMTSSYNSGRHQPPPAPPRNSSLNYAEDFNRSRHLGTNSEKMTEL